MEAWVQRYKDPAGGNALAEKVVTDHVGNAIVAGYTEGGTHGADFLVIKYSGDGVPMWTNRYDGPGNSNDQARAVAVDSTGNVFVTGNSIGSRGLRDFATVKYSGAGVPCWTNRYEGPGNSEPNAVAVDSSGNVFLTGYSGGSQGNADYATIAYSGAGVPLWTNRYNGPGNFGDLAYAVAVDGGGDVFVTGSSASARPPLYDSDYATIKYSGAGVPLWTNRYNAPGNDGDQATAMAVDGHGNVFVTGAATRSTFNLDYGTVAYSGAGVPLWTNLYTGPPSELDYATAVAVDASGNVFVTGRSLGRNFGGGYSYDYATVAYSGAGAPLWTNRYNGNTPWNDEASAVAVDGHGNVFVTGWSAANFSSGDFATIAYSGAGVPLWTNLYGGPAGGSDYATAVAVDGSGNVFVTGYSWSGSSYEFATIKYSLVTLLPIPLNHQVIGNQLVLSWTNAAFRLQSGPAVHGDYADVPSAMSPYNTGFSGTQRYFRLRAN